MEDSKPWWKSKTLRFNAAVAALGAIEANAQVIQPLLPVNFYSLLTVVLAAGNAMLRVITTASLTKD